MLNLGYRIHSFDENICPTRLEVSTSVIRIVGMHIFEGSPSYFDDINLVRSSIFRRDHTSCPDLEQDHYNWNILDSLITLFRF